MKTIHIFTSVVRLLVVLFLSNCQKNETFVVEGRITDFYSDHPVQNVKIELLYNSLNNGTFSNRYLNIAEAETDENGIFKLEFDYVSAVNYNIRATRSGYFQGIFVYQRDDWALNETNIVNERMLGQSSLEINLTNNNFNNQYLLRLSEHSLGCESCCNSGSYVFNSFSDTTVVCNVYSNQTIGYELIDTEAGEVAKKTGSIFIKPGNNVLNFNLLD
ncbi:MAG: carboxypeptidase-like regulatory domain-containing protein [Salibacteraceae bacterium]|nr:carboxypeptidase-like regulatory domain-containing protein [Salibacteraceae bacterium]